MNNDGRVDVVVSSIGSAAEVLINASNSDNHWLAVQTVGTKSNRDGLGTRIKLTSASGNVQYNHVTTAVGYASSSDKRVYFGLGSDKLVRELVLEWPSGIRQTMKNIAADQKLTVTEK